MRKRQGDGESQESDQQFEISVREEQRTGFAGVPSISPSTGKVAARAESEHEDGNDKRRGIHRVPEDIPENTDPDNLIDEPADAREEKQYVNHGRKVKA